MNILAILIQLIFSLFAGMVMLRFLLQRVKADFYNPICQFIVKVTNPLLVPLRRIIPGYFGLDLAALVLAYLSMLANTIVINGLLHYSFSGLIFYSALIRLITITVQIYFYAIFLRAIISWFQPNPHHPATKVLLQLTEPVLFYARKIIPPMGHFDFSPWLVLLGLALLRALLNQLFYI